MAYLKLSDQVAKLANPQRSDRFVKDFRDAVRMGEIEAVTLQEKFQLPKQFTRRSSDEIYSRSVKEMVFEATPAFDAWFDEANRSLASARTGGKLKANIENINAGLVDFKALAEDTRRKMQASYDKGQQLGHSRIGKKKGPITKAKGGRKTK